LGAHSFIDQAQQDVLGSNEFVVESLGFLVGQLHYDAGTVRKAFKHGRHLHVPKLELGEWYQKPRNLTFSTTGPLKFHTLKRQSMPLTLG
jgi:hypothetical protein